VAAGQPRAPPPGRQRVEQQPESDNEDVKVKEEEQTLGQLRDQLTRLPAPGPRAARVLIKIEDSKIGEDMDGSGDAEQEAAGEEVEEHQAEQTQAEAGVDVMAPVPRRARLPPGSYADLVVERDTDDDYEEEEEEEDADDEEDDDEEEDEEEEEEEGEQEGEDAGINVSGGAASWEANDRRSSQVAGVQWIQKKKQWEARHTVDGKRVNLGCHATKEAASLAIDNCVKDHGVKPDELRVRTSQSEGVYWNKRRGNWRAECKGKNVGVHATEEAAARAIHEYAKDGVDPVKHRGARTSQFKGVSWNDGWRDARGNASETTPRRRLRRGRTTRKLSGSVWTTFTSSRPPATLGTAATPPQPPPPPPPPSRFLARPHLRARTPALVLNALHRHHRLPLSRRRCAWTPQRRYGSGISKTSGGGTRKSNSAGGGIDGSHQS